MSLTRMGRPLRKAPQPRRAEVFFEYSLCPWDYAAASLIAVEAGAAASTLDGGPLPITRRSSVWISNPANCQVLKELDI